jgi:hypothetical protein
MFTKCRAAVLAASLAFASAMPALADDPWPNEPGDYVNVAMIKVDDVADDPWPNEPGDYVNVAMIKVDDGHDLHYMQYLAGQYRKSQDFAKAQGWITDYEILINVNPRPGEPDYYLITRFPRFADPAEQKKRDEAYDAHMKLTTAELQAGSAERAKYRTSLGSQLLRALKWKTK